MNRLARRLLLVMRGLLDSAITGRTELDEIT